MKLPRIMVPVFIIPYKIKNDLKKRVLLTGHAYKNITINVPFIGIVVTLTVGLTDRSVLERIKRGNSS
jgi:hypothetical protein